MASGANNTKSAFPDYKTAGLKHLTDLINLVLKKWWLFLIIASVAGLAGIFYAKQQKVTYQSKLTFALDQSGDESSLMSVAAQFGFSLGGENNVFAGDNIIQIMYSRRIVEQALLSEDTFQSKPFTFAEYFLNQKNTDLSADKAPKIHFPAGQARSSFSYAQDSLLYQLYNELKNNYITVDRPDRRNNIYEVNVTNRDEKFTKDFTDTLVNQTNKFYIDLTTKKSKRTLDILEQRVAAIKGTVNASIDNIAETQDVNINPAFSQAQAPILKQEVNMKAYGGAYTELFKNLEIARFQYLQQIPVMQIIDNADYPMKKIKVSKLKTALIFAIVACFITFLILWFRKFFKV